MTHPQEEIETVKVGKPAKQPAPSKRWRTLWCVERRCRNRRTGQIVEPTPYQLGALIFPSRELAEQDALEQQRFNAAHPPVCVFYLGPIQVEDAGE